MTIATWVHRRRQTRRTGNGRISIRRVAVAVALSLGAVALRGPGYSAQEKTEAADVLIVGAGISGLSAALEAARGGASVLVVDLSTVGGGHAILSNGAVSIVGTPLLEPRKIAESALEDAEKSNTEILLVDTAGRVQLDDDLMKELSERSKYVHLDPNEVLIEVGQTVNYVPLVVSGILKVSRIDESGNELLLYYVNPKESCAMTFTCCMQQHPSEVRAIAE